MQPLNSQIKADAVVRLAQKQNSNIPIDQHIKEYNYWLIEYDNEINRWEDDGGFIYDIFVREYLNAKTT